MTLYALTMGKTWLRVPEALRTTFWAVRVLCGSRANDNYRRDCGSRANDNYRRDKR